MMNGYKLASVVVGLLVLAACGEETPTGTGSSLLPGEVVQTFEVVFDADDYLVRDTSFSGYVEPFDAISRFGYTILAADFEDVLNARTLATFTIPTTISVIDSLGVQRTDSQAVFLGGELVVVLDTLDSSPAPATVQAFRATESWDAMTTTWTLRADSGGVQLPWSEPGGSPGVLAGEGTWTVADSLVIRVDSQTIAEWQDTANIVRGAVIMPSTPDVRLRTVSIQLLVDARSSIADTVVTLEVAPANRAFIFDPPVPRSVSGLRVSGVPGWRAIMQFRERLDTLTVPCPDTLAPAGCRIALRDASISYAALLLEPLEPPPGFSPEGELQLGAALLTVDSLIPIERSPIVSQVAGGLMPRALPASRFTDPAGPPVELPITPFISVMTRDTADAENRPLPYLALLPATGFVGSSSQISSFTTLEGLTFGFATFASRPRLRLMLTVAGEIGLQQ